MSSHMAPSLRRSGLGRGGRSRRRRLGRCCRCRSGSHLRRGRSGRDGSRCRRTCGTLRIRVDQTAHLTHRHDIAFFRFQGDDTGCLRRQFKGRLVGIHLGNRLVFVHIVPIGHQPCGDFHFGDALSWAGNFHFKNRHDRVVGRSDSGQNLAMASTSSSKASWRCWCTAGDPDAGLALELRPT